MNEYAPTPGVFATHIEVSFASADVVRVRFGAQHPGECRAAVDLLIPHERFGPIVRALSAFGAAHGLVSDDARLRKS